MREAAKFGGGSTEVLLLAPGVPSSMLGRSVRGAEALARLPVEVEALTEEDAGFTHVGQVIVVPADGDTWFLNQEDDDRPAKK